MKIKIYQVNSQRDKDHVRLMRMAALQKIQGNTCVNSTVYDCVFEGEVPCKDLEDVYAMFNRNHPHGYKARSLSVSDVVEVVADEKLKPGFYFCDSIGFQEVEFDPNKTQRSDRFCNLNEVETISVLLVQPGQYPKMVEIENNLEAMQKVVGGDIEEYMPFSDEVAIVCNEDGKAVGLPLNRAVYNEPMEEQPREMVDIIAGDFFVAYAPIESEKFLSLPPDLAEKYQERFKFPEKFVRTQNGIEAIPYKPVSKEMER